MAEAEVELEEMRRKDDSALRKLVVLCIYDGSIVPGANLQAQGATGLTQLRDAVKAKL